jgi:phosphatidylserine/phosphatidylglycerophosphate/cardiolipin synthase-like enzyme
MSALTSALPPSWKIAVLAGVCLLALALGGCLPVEGTPPSSPQPQPTVIVGDPSAAIEVFFSRPDDPASASLRGGPDARLAEAIDQARLSVDVAVLNLNLWSLRDALLAAHRRGVAVRFVVDSDYLDSPEVQDLAAAGIPVLGDRRESLMHHKFVVIDRREVWTGSMNFTLNGAYRNDNNLVRLQSEALAENYQHEFDEMFLDDRFGDRSRADTPHPEVSLDGQPVRNWFSPDDGVEARLVALIEGAGQSVELLAYSFTLDSLAEALLAQAENGLAVRAVLDAGQARSNQGGEYERLLEAGLDVWLDGNPDSMHHKVLIIDRRLVVTGSYNFSASAEGRNDENVLIVEDPQVAALYLAEFERIYQLANRGQD